MQSPDAATGNDSRSDAITVRMDGTVESRGLVVKSLSVRINKHPYVKFLIDQVKKVIHDPKVDVYVGKADGRIRRVALGLQFSIPQQAQALARGLKGGSMTISVEFAGVGQPQTITAPTSSKPLSDLATQLRGLGGLGGTAGGLGGSSSGSTGGATPTGRTPSAQQFQRYAQCLGKANPSDAAAIARCRALLK